MHYEGPSPLLPKDSADEKSAILEVRAGTGGEEAALFAAEAVGLKLRVMAAIAALAAAGQ